MSRLPDHGCLLFFFSLDCAVDLGIISNEDLMKTANGNIGQANDDEFAIKTVLELMNLLANMATICKDATELALKFLLTSTRENNFDRASSFRKRSRFTIEDEKEGEGFGPTKCKKIKTKVFDKTCSKASNVVTSEVTVNQKFELDDFFISDKGIVNLDGELLLQ